MGVPYAEVIGDPVEQSKSPLIHNDWLNRVGLTGEYRSTQVRPEQLQDYLRQRRNDPDWRGCNVTIPLKERVIRHLDYLDDRAALVGAVNCVVSGIQGFAGHNTDVDGIAAALDSTVLEGRRAALIGAGGAARAAMAYLSSRKVAEIAILVRDLDKAEPLRSLAPGVVEIGALGAAPALLPRCVAVINASPLGMEGFPPVPQEVIAASAALAGATLFDMVYQPVETEFLASARGRAVNGLTMLLGQAARAFELFFGSPAPAADDALLERLAPRGNHPVRASNLSNS
ncbi:shikimate dehydrogenase [Sphingomonas sp. F9_3S_D5_B_2]